MSFLTLLSPTLPANRCDSVNFSAFHIDADILATIMYTQYRYTIEQLMADALFHAVRGIDTKIYFGSIYWYNGQWKK